MNIPLAYLYFFIAILLLLIGLLSFICIRLILKKAEKIEKAKKETLTKSRAIIQGQVIEQLLPYFPDFPYIPSDVRFLGSPIDLIVFDGLSEGNLKQIIFLEVKTGKSGLSKREKQAKETIFLGNIDYKIVKL